MNDYINSDDEATCPGGCNQTVGMCLCAYQSCDDCNLPADQCVCPGLAYVQLAPDGEVIDCDHVRVLDVRREPYYIIDADGAVEKSGGVVVFDLSDFEIFDPPPGVSGDDHLRYLRCKIMSLVPKALRAGAYEYAYDGVRWLCDNFVWRDVVDGDALMLIAHNLRVLNAWDQDNGDDVCAEDFDGDRWRVEALWLLMNAYRQKEAADRLVSKYADKTK